MIRKNVFFGMMFVCAGLFLAVAGPAFAQETAPATPAAPAPAPAVTPPAAPVPADAPAVPAGPAPKIVCDAPEFDFGEVEEGAIVQHDYIIKNAGEGPLEIKKAQPSCGCTVARIEKSIVPPGEETKITANFNTARRPGEVTKTIGVESNDPVTPNLVLTLRGKVISAVMMEPRVFQFDKVLAGSNAEKKVTLRATKEDFHVTSVNCTLESVKVESREVEAGRVYDIVATLQETPAPGALSGVVTIQTDHPKAKELKITLYGTVVGPIDVTPQVISLRLDSDTNKKSTQIFRVAAGTVATFQVTEVIPPDPSIKFEVTNRTPGQYLIKLLDMPVDGSLEGKEMVIKTDAAEMPEIHVPVKMFKAPAPQPRPAVNPQRNPAPARPATPPAPPAAPPASQAAPVPAPPAPAPAPPEAPKQ